VTAPTTQLLNAAVEVGWTLECGEESLVGERLGASDIAGSRSDVLVRVVLADGRRFQAVLTPESPTFEIPARESRLAVGRSYGALGVAHILAGWDHLLFVIGLVLLVSGGGRLVKTVTAFTLGHSVTLSLAVLGFVRVPQAAAESMIALSIFVLAVELARDAALPPTLLGRRPWAMAAAFGLLHGLGFAGALAESGLPPGEIPLALASFNLGIELGQLAIVVVTLALRAALARVPWRWPDRLTLAPAYAIGALAAFWLYDRAAPALHAVISWG
jgi:hydrogenase/urease accessory protein HupE